MKKDTIGRITYRLHGVEKTWEISCHPEFDNEKTLKAHLKEFLPRATFIKAEIKKGILQFNNSNKP